MYFGISILSSLQPSVTVSLVACCSFEHIMYFYATNYYVYCYFVYRHKYSINDHFYLYGGVVHFMTLGCRQTYINMLVYLKRVGVFVQCRWVVAYMDKKMSTSFNQLLEVAWAVWVIDTLSKIQDLGLVGKSSTKCNTLISETAVSTIGFN